MAKDDDTFRQERPPIDPSEIGVTPGEGEKTLDDVHAIRRQAGLDVAGEDEPGESIPAVPRPAGAGSVQPIVRDGMSVSGQMPPAMQQALQQRISEVEGQATGGPPPSDTPPPPPMSPAFQPQLTVNDPALQELLAGLTTQNYEEVVLPSLGRFYSSDRPRVPHAGRLHIRPMTGQEESILSTVRFMRQGRGIEMIFNNCIQEDIDSEQLLSVDRIFLLIYLRGISYGNLYDVKVGCPECNHTFDHEIDLNLDVEYCPDDFSIDLLTQTLPESEYKFQYRLMTGNDETEVSQHRDKVTSGGPNTIDDTFLFRASIMIDWIGTSTTQISEKHGIRALLGQLSAKDVNYIRNVLSNPPFGADTVVKMLCPSCYKEYDMELPYEANFFFPQVKESPQLA